MPATTIIFTDAGGRDLARPAEHATFRTTTPCAAIEWAARMVVQAASMADARVGGFRVEVAS